MQKNVYKLLVMISAYLLITSCASGTPTEDGNIIMTSAVNTMVASFFETQTALITPALPTSTQTYTAFPTNTAYPTITGIVSPTYIFLSSPIGTLTPASVTPTGTQATATFNAGASAVGCNNLFFIRDVSVPAGTVIQKNQDFTKTWKVQNNGTCDWLYQYILVPISGDTFGSEGTKIQKLVKVNNWTELTVGMTAPDKAGTYTSTWRLSNGHGTFGATLVLSFVVSDPASPTSIPMNTNTFTAVPTDTPSETATMVPTPTQ